jgi:flagella basal body P-ring formation protein FlgA
MRITIPISILIVAAIAAPAQQECIAVRDETILARDLSPRLPEFATAPADLEVGRSPVVGATRWITAAQLSKLAIQAQVSIPTSSDVCVVRTARIYSEAEVLDAVDEALSAVDWKDRVAELKLIRIPYALLADGKLSFHVEDLQRSSIRDKDGVMTWRGRLAFSQAHWAPFPVVLRIRVRYRGLIAANAIAKGSVITDGDLVDGEWTGGPFSNEGVLRREDLRGTKAAIAIAKGDPIRAKWLFAPADVSRGDVVAVTVKTGSATLVMDARSRSVGRKGSTVVLQSPISKRVFQATVTGPRTAAVSEKLNATKDPD